MQLPGIVGVAGTNGSGKDTLGELLQKKFGYHMVSLSDVLRTELTRQGKPHTRENLSGLSQQIRTAEGDGAMAARTLAEHGGEKLSITSIRAPGEVAEIQKAGGVVVWIDADPRIRYERIAAAARGRVDDTVSFEEFLRQERAEMNPTEQGGGLNMQGVKDAADTTVMNEFATVEEYRAHLVKVFEL